MNDGVSCLLAEIPEFGLVYDCGSCGGIHVSVGHMSATFTPEAYLQFVALIHSSAANFEVWREHKRELIAGPANVGETRAAKDVYPESC